MDDTAQHDAALARRLASGDRAALATAFDRYAPTLTRYAWAVVDSPQDVEAVVQDAFLTLWRRADGLQLATDSLLPWLLVTCRDHAQSLRQRSAEEPGERGARQTAADDDPLRWVRDDLAALPEADRRLCDLGLAQGHTYADAARLLGLDVGAATDRGSRSRRRPRKAVTHDEH